MTDPFTILKDSLAPYLFGSTDAAGFVLGTAVIVAMVIAIQWAFEGGKKGSSDSTTFIISASIGYIFVVVVGWYPLWTVVILAIILMFVILDPFGSSSRG